MKLTYEDTRMLETAKGGFKSSTLAILGESSPPAKGWRSRIMQREITEAQFAAAIADSEIPPRKKSKGQRKIEAAHRSEGQQSLF